MRPGAEATPEREPAGAGGNASRLGGGGWRRDSQREPPPGPSQTTCLQTPSSRPPVPALSRVRCSIFIPWPAYFS